MHALILFRSLTYAQRGSRILGTRGIVSNVIKAPMGTTEKGCAYALSLRRDRLDAAVRALREENALFERAFVREEDGRYREIIV